MSAHIALTPHPAGKVSDGGVLSFEEGGVVRLTGLPILERALLTVGSERSATRTAQKLYGLDVGHARLLVKVIREGTADDAGSE